MSLNAFAETLQNTALGQVLAHASPPLIVSIQMVHVLGLVLLLSTVLLINLRLLGLGLARQPLPPLLHATRWPLWLGLLLAVASGALLYLSAPVPYIGNPAFLPKLTLLLTAVALQLALLRAAARGDGAVPRLARGGAVLSLTLWLSVGMAGRAIGFV